MNWQERTELIIGNEGIQKLKNSHVLIVGMGGVGGATAEMLARAGVGKMTIVDNDFIHSSNRNRQIIALGKNEGRLKVEAWSERIKEISPDIEMIAIKEYLKDDKIIEILDKSNYDYVVDAIDTLSPKAFFIYHCLNRKMPLVSSMGAGGRLNPELVKIDDISRTYNCKLALYVRKRLHKLGVNTGFDAVFSAEKVQKEYFLEIEEEQNKKSIVGVISYMPNIFGCFCASVVIRNLLHK